MTGIRDLTDTWVQSTWEEQLISIKVNPEIKTRLVQVLTTFKLLKEKISGESVTKLPRTAEGQFPKGLDISYTRALDTAYFDNPEKLPVLYLLNLTSKFDFGKYSEGQFEGLIARGLRTFPSLLRDRDFGESLRRLLLEKGFSNGEFKVVVAPEEDIPQHTDVLLDFRGRLFRIWLYQFSFAGLPHDVERILGRRGELPPGIHLLCPLKASIALQLGVLERRKTRLSSRSEKKKAKTFQNMICKGALECRQDIITIQKQISENETKFKQISALADKEISTINGWYFFSDQKVAAVITRISEIAKNEITPDAYADVCGILEGPEKYLGEIRFFFKPD